MRAWPRRRDRLLTTLALTLLTLSSWASGAKREPVVSWTMINVNTAVKQGDAHLLEMPDGKRLLIDVADAGMGAVPFLKERGIKKLDAVVISHPHKDHYGALPELLGSGVAVKTLYLNVPPRDLCDSERPWGCDMPHILEVLDSFRRRGVSVRSVRPGDVLYKKDKVSLEALYAFDGVNTPIGKTDVNDMSLIMRLQHGSQRVLFTGDLNQPMGAWLAEHGEGIEAEILKVPHHGTEGVAPNAFFDRVAAAAALIPAPEHLWLSDRSKRIREHFASRGTLVFVNGLHGHVLVRLGRSAYQVETRRAGATEP